MWPFELYTRISPIDTNSLADNVRTPQARIFRDVHHCSNIFVVFLAWSTMLYHFPLLRHTHTRNYYGIVRAIQPTSNSGRAQTQEPTLLKLNKPRRRPFNLREMPSIIQIIRSL